MANINELYPSKYLKSADIKGKGEPTVAIDRVEVEEVGDGEKPVIYFQNRDKGMVLNRTNAETIAELYGEDYEEWAGREVTIFVARVQGPNGMTDGLRLKSPPKRKAAKPVVNKQKGYSTVSTPAPAEEEPPPHTEEDIAF